MSKREIQEKELKNVLSKDIGAKNPVFASDSIAELHALFSLYADPRQRRADVRELLLTAGTLGLEAKYEFVFRLLQEVNDSTGGNALDFEGFLKELTARIVLFVVIQGSPFSEEGRKANFRLLDVQGKGELDLNDLRYINDQLKYGYSDDQLIEIVHSVGGFGAETISWDKFNKFIERKVIVFRCLPNRS